MKQLLILAFTDFKLIFRDPSLRVFLAFPLILFALIIWGVPSLIENFDYLVPYLPVFLAIALIENTQMFSFISSMVLIDEKETEVAKVYGVVPLTKAQYIFSRMTIPFIFTMILNFILFACQPFYEVSLRDTLALSVLAALVVPVYVLAINSIAKNRMQGMVYIKAFNMIVILPAAAFFVPEQFQILFGIFPTHWIYSSVELLSNGLSISIPVLIGLVFTSGLLWFAAHRFLKVHFHS